MQRAMEPLDGGSGSGSESEAEGEAGGCCRESKRHEKGKVDHNRTPGHKAHGCTDVLCLLLFLSALGFLGWIIHYTTKHGDLRRLYHGYNFLGELCGMDNDFSNLTSKPVLFWCKNKAGTGLDLAHPICRESCPTAGDTSYPCYDDAVLGKKVILPNSPEGSFERNTEYLFRKAQDYPSQALMGVYCYPADRALQSELMEFMKNDGTTKLLVEALSVDNAWPVLVASAIASLLLGFVYLYFLKACAGCMTYSSLAILCATPLGFGALFIVNTYTDVVLSEFHGTGNKQWDTIIGIACVIVSILFILISCCASNSIQLAIRVVQATSSALMAMPSLLLEPVITQTIRLLVLGSLMFGFLFLISCGRMTTMTIEEFAAISTAETQIHGVFRKFTFTETQWYYIIYYGFMIVWIMCICTAAAQFALAYAVQAWYFTPVVSGKKKGVPSCAVCKGYRIGYFFHTGSLAFGSFLIALLVLIRVFLAYLTSQSKGKTNATARAALSCLSCCVACFQKCLEFLNKNAYMDMALNSSTFCFAARNAFNIITKNLMEIAILNGACCIFQLAGVGAITGICCFLSYMALTNLSDFKEPESPRYVADPIAVTVLSGLISFIVSYAFMMVYDMVADTVLYCYATEQIRRVNSSLAPDVQYAPDGLDKLVSGRDSSSDSS